MLLHLSSAYDTIWETMNILKVSKIVFLSYFLGKYADSKETGHGR